jgi:hypothetical protein
VTGETLSGIFKKNKHTGMNKFALKNVYTTPEEVSVTSVTATKLRK